MALNITICYSRFVNKISVSELSVSSVWLPSMMEKLIMWFPKQCSQLHFWLFFALEPEKKKENLKWNCFALIYCLPINITLRNTLLMLKQVLLESPCTNLERDDSTICENSSLSLLKNSNNVSDNINLIRNTYKCLFFKLLLRILNVIGQLRRRWDESVGHMEMKKLFNLQHSKYLKP